MTRLTYLSVLSGLLAGSAIVGSSVPAQAFNFTLGTSIGSCASLLSGSTPVSCNTADGFTIKAGPDGKVLQTKTVVDDYKEDDGYKGPVIGVGVSQGSQDTVTGEINVGEYIDLFLPGQGGILNSLDFSFLYPPGEFEDTVFEVVSADPSLPGVSGKLTIKNDHEAVWSVTGLTGLNQTIQAISKSIDGKPSGTHTGGGWYSVVNPFGNSFFQVLRLNAPSQPGAKVNTHRNNDYSLVGATIKPVPEPATLVGLAAVGSFLVASRRRKLVKG